MNDFKGKMHNMVSRIKVVSRFEIVTEYLRSELVFNQTGFLMIWPCK